MSEWLSEEWALSLRSLAVHSVIVVDKKHGMYSHNTHNVYTRFHVAAF